MEKDREKIFVFGASGHAKVVIDIIEKMGIYDVAFMIDDALSLKDRKIYGYKVIGGKDELIDACRRTGIKRGIVAIGDNLARRKVAEWLASSSFELVTVIHPSAQIARGVSISNGTVVMANVVINSDAAIGENVIINTAATVDHDCMVGCGVHIAPGSTLCGGVSVGNSTLIGAGTKVIPNIKIGKNVVIGAGTTVFEDIPDDIRLVGTRRTNALNIKNRKRMN